MDRFSRTVLAVISALGSIAAVIGVVTQFSEQVNALETAATGGQLSPEYAALSSQLYLVAIGFGLIVLGLIALISVFVMFSEVFGILVGSFLVGLTPAKRNRSRLIGYAISTTIIGALLTASAFIFLGNVPATYIAIFGIYMTLAMTWALVLND